MKISACIRKKKTDSLEKMVSEASVITVTAHTHPDGDAVGSAVALCCFLREKCGKDAAVVLPDSVPGHLRFIAGDSVLIKIGDADGRIGRSDLVFLLDANEFSRTEGLADALKTSNARKILIDHHLNPAKKDFDLVFSTPEISSASELLYWILKKIAGHAVNLPAKSREALLAGMTTDTNNFANSVFPSTLQMASELIAAGTDRDAILLNIYNCYRENRIRLMGYMQDENMVITPEGAAYMVLSREIQEKFGYMEGETEGLVNIPLGIKKVRLSILLTEHNDHFRVSVRSKKGTSAQKFAQEYFHGGGHENAAGGKLFIGEDIPGREDAPLYLENAIKAFLA